MEETIFRGKIVNCVDIPASPENGFNFPFRIIIPKELCDNPDLIYACNLTPDYSDKCANLDELCEEVKKDLCSIDPVHGYLCLNRGNPMLIPFIPRLKGIRPNFLGVDCFKNKFNTKYLGDNYKKDVGRYYNLPDQISSMIKYAVNYLRSVGVNVDDRIIISGYSEGAKFASHFALLHPETIKAVIAGGTGGCMSMPVERVDEYEFVYPTGIADITNFDFESFKRISFFYYIGDADRTDSAIPYFENIKYIDEEGKEQILRDECGNPTPRTDENGFPIVSVDENGKYRAKFSNHSDDDVDAINKALGLRTMDRFLKQHKIYEDLGLDVISMVYPGDHRSIFNNRDIIRADLDNFFAKYITSSRSSGNIE